MSDFHNTLKKLLPSEEDIIVNHLLIMADRALPLTQAQTVDLANSMIEACGGPKLISATSGWVYDFLVRHDKKIKSTWGKPLDMKWAQALNPEAVSHWFNDVVRKHMVDKETRVPIAPKLIFGMDKSGFP